MNVLITSASRKVSLVRAFQAALSQEEVVGAVVAVDSSPLSPSLYIADDHYIVSRSTEPEFLTVMLHLCERLSVKLLIPTRDEELPFFAEHKELFAGIGTMVMVSDSDSVAICQDKKKFISFCKENGFQIPASWNSEDLPTDLSFPLFAKPRFGKGGSYTMKIDSAMELKTVLRKIPEAIIQEYIQDQEYTIDLFADFSGRVISVVPRTRMYIVSGESYISQTIKDHNLINESVRLASQLNLIGHNTIQCFFSDQKEIRFIEVNPRFGGGANLGFAAGAHTPAFLVKLLKGERLEPVIGEFRDNFIMLRYTDDLFLGTESLLRPVDL